MRPSSSYLIMATPRSGSYLLCEALINTNLAGRPTEYFGPVQTRSLLRTWDVPDYAACLTRIIEEGTTPNGVFGAKIIWQFMEDFADHLRDIPGYEKVAIPQLMSSTFPRLHYIWITRRDKVRQAISFYKAIQTQGWLDIEGWQQQSARKEAIFNFKAIERLRRGIEEDEAEMQQYFISCGVQPFKVVYEDFVSTYEETVSQILACLQILVPGQLVFGERKLKKQANEQSEEWVQRYYEMKQKDDRGQ